MTIKYKYVLLTFIFIMLFLLFLLKFPKKSFMERDKVILTCFSGREYNMKILTKYVDKLLESDKIDEFHMWNFTRNENDENYLKSLESKKYYKLITPKDKSKWTEYYNFYKNGNDEDIIIKIDDDILFIDVDNFSDFIEERKRDKETFLMFPSIINNGVCAWYQQQKGLIPKTLHEFKYQPFMGDVVENGDLGTRIHKYFLENKEEMIKKSESLEKITINIGDRTSINFFAMFVKDFKLLNDINDDEHEMSVEWPKNLNRHNSIYMPFIVSHGSFGPQKNTGLDENVIVEMYEKHVV